MKRFFIYGLISILASLSLAQAGSAAPDNNMGINKKIPATTNMVNINKLNTVPKISYPDRTGIQIPKADWYIYAMVTPKTDMEQSQMLAEKLLSNKLTNRFSKADEKLIYVDQKDPSTFYTQDSTTGSISFANQLSSYFGDNVPKLPEEKASSEIAIKFLREMNLYPKNSTELTILHVGGLRTTAVDNEKQTSVIDKLRTITFGRKINNIAVQGTNSKIVIHIGDNGKIVGMNYKWREVGKAIRVKPTDIKEIALVKREISSMLTQEWKQASSIYVTKIALVYYDNGGRYIQPAYMFEAVIMEGEDKYSYMGAIAALKQPPESISLEKAPPEAYKYLRVKPTTMEQPNKDGE